MLKRASACKQQLELFNKLYPDGIEDTIENIKIAIFQGLDVLWAIEMRIIKPTICIAYDDSISYYQDGLLHRTDGPAYEHTDGRREWWVNGNLHRIDGPAIINNSGTKCYYQNDLLHRTDGPAIERYNGTKEWWMDGKRFSETEFSTLFIGIK